MRLLQHGVRADLNGSALINVRSVLRHPRVQELWSRDAVGDARFADFRERLAVAAVPARRFAGPLEAPVDRPRHSIVGFHRFPTPDVAFLRTVYLEYWTKLMKSMAQENDVSHEQRIAGGTLEGAVQQRVEADESGPVAPLRKPEMATTDFEATDGNG